METAAKPTILFEVEGISERLIGLETNEAGAIRAFLDSACPGAFDRYCPWIIAKVDGRFNVKRDTWSADAVFRCKSVDEVLEHLASYYGGTSRGFVHEEHLRLRE